MRLADYDLTKDSVQVQEAIDDIKRVINNGLYEIQVTSSSEPDFDAPNEPIVVLSLYGTQYRIYFGYAGRWYHATLTAL